MHSKCRAFPGSEIVHIHCDSAHLSFHESLQEHKVENALRHLQSSKWRVVGEGQWPGEMAPGLRTHCNEDSVFKQGERGQSHHWE